MAPFFISSVLGRAIGGSGKVCPSRERLFRRIGRGWLWVLSYCLEKEKSMDGFFL